MLKKKVKYQKEDYLHRDKKKEGATPLSKQTEKKGGILVNLVEEAGGGRKAHLRRGKGAKNI